MSICALRHDASRGWRGEARVAASMHGRKVMRAQSLVQIAVFLAICPARRFRQYIGLFYLNVVLKIKVFCLIFVVVLCFLNKEFF